MRAEITRQEKGFTARFERRLQLDVEGVWNILADNSSLQQWSGELRIAENGKDGKLIFDEGNGAIEELPITEYEENRIFAFKWRNNHVRFEIERESQSRSILWLVEQIGRITPQTASDLAAWHVRLDMFEAIVNGENVDREETRQHWLSEYTRLIKSMTVEFE